MGIARDCFSDEGGIERERIMGGINVGWKKWLDREKER